MKRFLKKITVFFSTTLFLYFSFQIAPLLFIYPKNIPYQFLHQIKFFAKKTKPDIAFYGDSKNYTNFDIKKLRENLSYSTYNFSISGGNMQDADYFYGDDFLNGKIVNIINLNDVIFCRERIIGNKYRYMITQIPIDFYISRPWYFKQKFDNGFACLEGQYIPDFDYDRDNNNAERIQKCNKETLKKNINTLNAMIAKKNAPTLFVIHPDRVLRKKFLDSVYGSNFLDSIYQSSFSKHPLIDFRKHKILLEDTLYADTHHLNSMGNRLLTDFFVEEYKKSISKYPYLKVE